jgi:ribosomal protein S18 acetylase RimI-like enzyme
LAARRDAMPDVDGHAAPWRIGVARPADALRLAAAGLRCRPPADLPRDAERWRARLADAACLTLLAEAASGRVLAVLEASSAADEAEVVDIVVTPDGRRQGIARALLSRLRCELGARGIGRLFLEVAVDNEAALALYKAEGFTAVATRRGYYARTGGAPVDALVMRLDLGGGRAGPPPAMNGE